MMPSGPRGARRPGTRRGRGGLRTGARAGGRVSRPRSLLLVAAALSLVGCVGTSGNAALNRGAQTVEVYHNVEVRADPGSPVVREAVLAALNRHFSSVVAQRPALIGPPPETYPRVERSQLLAGTRLATLAAAQGGSAEFSSARCDGATLVARAVKSSGVQVLVANVCVFPYARGQSVQILGAYTDRRSGGLASLVEAGVSQTIGSAGDFWNAAMADLANSLKTASGGAVTYRDGSGGLL